MNESPINRRRFIGESACSLLGSSAVLNTLINLKLAGSACAAESGSDSSDENYRALVCVFLFGGNDSFNMLVPTTDGEYSHYKKTRGDLALPKTGDNALLELKDSGIAGRNFAVHPSAAPLRSLYHQGKLAFVSNVGTLVEPTSVEQYKRKNVRLPKSLFSHNDQRDQWQTSVPQMRGSEGWLGRAADLMQGNVDRHSVSMNISLSGNNLLQTGRTSTAYNITTEGSVGLNNPLARELFPPGSMPAPESESDAVQRSLFESVFARATRDSILKDRTFSEAFNAVSLTTAPPPNNPLGNQLHAIARTIGARKKLGQKRQTFFVMLNGWDTHQELLDSHQALLSTLSTALMSFQKSLTELGVDKDVTTFTCSDFGRTLRSNGRGSDHAWGGNSMVMGGAVKGGTIYGDYPEALVLNDGLDVGTNGRLLPTTSCDAYFCELLRWFGVPAAEMASVLPNVDNFLDPGASDAPIGFLG